MKRPKSNARKWRSVIRGIQMSLSVVKCTLRTVSPVFVCTKFPIEVSDQTARMRRLIWFLAGRTCPNIWFFRRCCSIDHATRGGSRRGSVDPPIPYPNTLPLLLKTKIFAHLTLSLRSTSPFYYQEMYLKYWIRSKQCRLWSDAVFCSAVSDLALHCRSRLLVPILRVCTVIWSNRYPQNFWTHWIWASLYAIVIRTLYPRSA